MKHIVLLVSCLLFFNNMNASFVFSKEARTPHGEALIATLILLEREKEIEIDEKSSPSNFLAIAPEISELEIVSGPKNIFKAESNPEILKRLKMGHDKDTLYIDFESKLTIAYDYQIRCTLQLKPAVLAGLRSITTNMNTVIKSPMNVPKLSINIIGNNNHFEAAALTIDDQLTISVKEENAGLINFSNVRARQLMIKHAGSRLLKIAEGSVDSGDVTVSKSGLVDISGMRASSLSIDLSKKARGIDCLVSDNLFGTIDSSKQVTNHTKARSVTLLSHPF